MLLWMATAISVSIPEYLISTIAGNGVAGFAGDGGPAIAASFNLPFGLTVSLVGSPLIVDTGNNRLRFTNNTSTGTITTVAGNGSSVSSGDGGLATSAGVPVPTAVVLDLAGNLYLSERYDARVRRISAVTSIISSFAGTGEAGFSGDGGSASLAQLNQPWGLAVSPTGMLFIADTMNDRVRAVSTSNIITTVAGSGTTGFGGDGGLAVVAMLSYPAGLAFSSLGVLFIADVHNNRIRAVSSSGIITTVAGSNAAGFSGDGGLATLATLFNPLDVSVDTASNLFIADTYNSRIRFVSTVTGVINTVAGNGGFGYNGDGMTATSSQLNRPMGVAIGPSNSVWISDSYNQRVRKLTLCVGACSQSPSSSPTGTTTPTVTPSATFTRNIEPPPEYLISTIAGNGVVGFAGDGGPATDAEVDHPVDIYPTGAGLIIADTYNVRLRFLNYSTQTISTIAGTGIAGSSGDGGPALAANLYYPVAVALNLDGDILVGEFNRLRIIFAADFTIGTLAGTGGSGFSGDGGPATLATVGPGGIAVAPAGVIFVSDEGNHRVRVIFTNGTISTVAGSGCVYPCPGGFSGDGGSAVFAQLGHPTGISLALGVLYIADTFNSRIRALRLDTGIITTVVGSGCGYGCGGYGGDGGLAVVAVLNNPEGVVADELGNLWVTDTQNNVIRFIGVSGVINTVAGNYFLGADYTGDGMKATGSALNFPRGIKRDMEGGVVFADHHNTRVRKLSPCVGACSQSPTASASATSTPSVTSTPSSTSSSSATITSSITSTPSASSTLSSTPSTTPTLSATLTPSATSSSTTSPSATSTCTPTYNHTPLPTTSVVPGNVFTAFEGLFSGAGGDAGRRRRVASVEVDAEGATTHVNTQEHVRAMVSNGRTLRHAGHTPILPRRAGIQSSIVTRFLNSLQPPLSCTDGLSCHDVSPNCAADTPYNVPEWCTLARWQPQVLGGFGMSHPITVRWVLCWGRGLPGTPSAHFLALTRTPISTAVCSHDGCIYVTAHPVSRIL